MRRMKLKYLMKMMTFRQIRTLCPTLGNVRGNSTHSNGGYWMPFTDHQRFHDKGKVFNRAEGVYYYTADDNRQIYDGMSGLWCVNAGHGQRKIIEAIQKQAATLDFAPSFNSSHTLGPKFADKLLALLPNRGFKDVFFTMCGSTAVDSAMKIALAYHRAKGDSTRVRFIGRERAYHGVGFGGISVGGIMANRKAFSGSLLPYVDHLPHTHSIKNMAFSKGQPTWGAHLAEDLERLVALHDASSIAAVFIEPVAGSTGVLPPPQGYLERIREICTKHNILLVFDEVITGFGRLGASFATEKFNVTPDIITCAKGLTNASVPAGAVICKGDIFESIYSSAHSKPEMQIEFFHGYTYRYSVLVQPVAAASCRLMRRVLIHT
jgi:beta-alanine--pyruvate transaminase